jgi:uncharacterized membrane protein
MPISCPDCAAEMPDAASYCPGCGRAMRPVERARGMVGALPETLAGALAYFLLPAIVFLFVEPYKGNRFVRFHSFQCLGFFLASVVVVAALRIVGFVLFYVPVIGHPLVWLVSMIIGLALFTIWIVLIVKALQGEIFKLPLLGDVAERQTLAV